MARIGYARVSLYSDTEVGYEKYKNITAWHTYCARAEMDGQQVYIQLSTFELSDGQEVLSEYHDHNVTWAEIIKRGELVGPDPVTNRLVTQSHLSHNKIFQWMHSVKHLLSAHKLKKAHPLYLLKATAAK